jgi:phosphoglycerate dehydrogenase-like enzyme
VGVHVWFGYEGAIPLLGELPDGVVVGGGMGLPEPDTEFWAPQFLTRAPSPEEFDRLPKLRVVQLLSAGADLWVDQTPTHVTLCDGRGVHSSSTAEWAVGAVLAYLRGFPAFIIAQARREWASQITDELAGKRVLIVGAGDVGEAIAARLAPFEVTLTRVARRARAGVHPISALPDLLPEHDVVILVVPLTPATTGLVDPEFLRRMPDGALLVNAARGQVVQTDALVAELSTGRIAAALDVTEPEPLPPDHPLWTMPNVLLTPHVGAAVTGLMRRACGLAAAQIRRYVAGQPLINVVADGY